MARIKPPHVDHFQKVMNNLFGNIPSSPRWWQTKDDDSSRRKVLKHGGMLQTSLKKLLSNVVEKEPRNDTTPKVVLENYHNENHTRIATMMITIGDAHVEEGEFEEAQEAYQGALRVAGNKQDGVPDPLYVAHAMLGMGNLSDVLGQTDPALAWLEEARHIFEQNVGKASLVVSDALEKIGCIYLRTGDHNLAIKYYREAIRIKKLHLGEKHVDVAKLAYMMGIIHREKGNTKKALKRFEEALEVNWATVGKKHSNVANVLNGMGVVLFKEGKYGEAMELYEEALCVIRASRLLPSHPCVLEVHRNIDDIKKVMSEMGECDL